MILATLETKQSDELTKLSEFIHAMGRMTALEETQRSRTQDVQKYPGYERELQIANEIIERTVAPMEFAFSPELDERTRLSEDRAQAEAQVFLGKVLKKVVESPSSEFMFV